MVAVAAAALRLALVAAPGIAQETNSATAPTLASGRCGVCHPRERVAFESSRHAGEYVHCTSCHGGNDQALEAAAAHQGFRGRIDRAAIPGLCASCHSDESKMRPYDLPVDQYALYQLSGHGMKLKAGDTRVAVCSDCHGAHDILPASDPASRTYVTNIPRTCGACHGDSTLMRPRGIADSYHAYLGSVHARELLDRGNHRAPTCVDCHGVHGAAPPSVGDVNTICGRCHTAERRYYLAGPHAAALARQGLAECSSCHGDHAIPESSPERLAAGCIPCHARGTRDAEIGAALWTDYRDAAHELDGAEGAIAKADAVPIATDDYRSRIEEARTYLREGLIAAHAVDPQVMASFTARARSVGSEVRTEIDHKLYNIRVSKIALIVFWFYVLVTIGILRRSRNRAPRAS